MAELMILDNNQEYRLLVKRVIIFLAGIYFIQGICQGGISGLFYLPLSFMLRDHLGFNQEQLAYFRGLVLIPWAIKPLYGLLSDFIPILGYRRRSWYVIAALLGIGCALYLAGCGNYTENQLLFSLAMMAVSFAFCDVLCDAVMVEKGKPLGLTDKFQGVQWASISLAAVLSGLCGGLIAEYLNYQQIFLAMAVPSFAVLIIAVFFVPEKKHDYKQSKKSETASVITPKEAIIVFTIVLSVIPILFFLNMVSMEMETLPFLMFVSPFLILGSLCFLFRKLLNKMIFFCIIFLFWWDFCVGLTAAPFFYYQTYTLGFSKMFMGTLQTIGSVGGLLGALVFLSTSRRKIFWKKQFIIETNLANLLKWAGFIGVVFILSNFLLMGKTSAIVLSVVMVFVYQFARLTMLVLAAEFCPTQIAGTFFALLMSVCNLGSSMAERVSGFLFKVLKNTAPQNFIDNFWAKFLTWLNWPIQHADPKAPYDIFVQYHIIGWLIIISLCAFSLYFFAIRRFGDSIKEKEELKTLDISPAGIKKSTRDAKIKKF
ncbi:MFS transporter [Patescibacteria group bacterium]|nr:MFS transporter [Patescibacteria group bacterium]MBU2633390.1 MFS transporter [Patescibacteria group bacterium]